MLTEPTEVAPTVPKSMIKYHEWVREEKSVDDVEMMELIEVNRRRLLRFQCYTEWCYHSKNSL